MLLKCYLIAIYKKICVTEKTKCEDTKKCNYVHRNGCQVLIKWCKNLNIIHQWMDSLVVMFCY